MSDAQKEEALRLGTPLTLLLVATGLWCVLTPFQWAHAIGRYSNVAYLERLSYYVPELVGAVCVVVSLVLLGLRRSQAIVGFGLGSVLVAALALTVGSPSEAWWVSCGLMGASAWQVMRYFDRVDEQASDAEAQRALAPFLALPAGSLPELRLVDQEPDRWFLLRHGDALALDVNCGHEVVSYGFLIALDVKETAQFKAEGRSALDSLAESIVMSNPGHRDSDSPYRKRRLPSEWDSAVTAAVLAWREGRPYVH